MSGKRRAEKNSSLGDDAGQWAELDNTLQAPGAVFDHNLLLSHAWGLRCLRGPRSRLLTALAAVCVM